MRHKIWNPHKREIVLSKVVFMLCIVLTPLIALGDEFTKEDEIRAMQYLDGLIQSQMQDEQREITYNGKPTPKIFCEEGGVSRAHELNVISNRFNSASFGFGYMWNLRDENKPLPPRFFSFDIGSLGLPSECANRKFFFGVRARYEQALDIHAPLDSVFRLGAEGYYHPQLLNFKGHQALSFSLGFGYRFKHANLESGNYIDFGALLYPSFPVHFALIYRTDYAKDTPTQHSFRISLKIPINIR